MPARIALSGYYGCGNAGDEAVLAGIVESFVRRAGRDAARFTVLSADPADTERRHGLHAMPRMGLGALRRTLRDCDLLISGGGSLLQDTTSLRSLVYYTGVIWLAHLMRRPVMLYAQGIGPLRRPLARRLVRAAAERARRITVRDPGSAALLSEIGVARPDVEVTADPAFALTPASADCARAILEECGVPRDRPVIGIALRPWKAAGSGDAAGRFASMAAGAAKLVGAHTLYVPMQPPGDVELANEVARGSDAPSSIMRAGLTPHEAVGLTGLLDGLIGMRLHALIFGAMGGVPLAAIAYDPKVASLMGRIGQAGRSVSLDQFDPEVVAHALADAMAEGEGMRAALRKRAGELAELALSDVDRALDLAGRGT